MFVNCVLLTAAKVDQEAPVEVFVVYEGSVDPGAGAVVDTEIVEVRITTKKITLLLVYHQLLD